MMKKDLPRYVAGNNNRELAVAGQNREKLRGSVLERIGMTKFNNPLEHGIMQSQYILSIHAPHEAGHVPEDMSYTLVITFANKLGYGMEVYLDCQYYEAEGLRAYADRVNVEDEDLSGYTIEVVHGKTIHGVIPASERVVSIDDKKKVITIFYRDHVTFDSDKPKEVSEAMQELETRLEQETDDETRHQLWSEWFRMREKFKYMNMTEDEAERERQIERAVMKEMAHE